MKKEMNVGGQALIEGIMMRSPNALVISLRDPEGKIIVKDSEWTTFGGKKLRKMPLIRGVNDNAEVMAELFAMLSFIGVLPYYVFQCRPVLGNKDYTVPVEEGYTIFEQAKGLVSGLAKIARFVMSHSTGKIEIAAKIKGFVYFKYHRAAHDQDSGEFIVCKSNPKAYWFDDYKEVIKDYPMDLPYRSYGPE